MQGLDNEITGFVSFSLLHKHPKVNNYFYYTWHEYFYIDVHLIILYLYKNESLSLFTVFPSIFTFMLILCKQYVFKLELLIYNIWFS